MIEAEKVGGRLALIKLNGQDYEAGGAIIHPKNAYMVNFTQQFGEFLVLAAVTSSFFFYNVTKH